MMYCQISETPKQYQAVGKCRDDQGANQRADDGADASGETCASQDNGGNSVEFIGLAHLQSVGSHQSSGRHDGPHTRQQTGYGINEEQDFPDLDPR